MLWSENRMSWCRSSKTVKFGVLKFFVVRLGLTGPKYASLRAKMGVQGRNFGNPMRCSVRKVQTFIAEAILTYFTT